MASSDFLRKNKNQHSQKNIISKKMDKDIDKAIVLVLENLQKKYKKIQFYHEKSLMLTEFIDLLKQNNLKYAKHFANVLKSSYIKPDGGFIYFIDKSKKKRIILIAEVKQQGTNDKRKKEGKPKQALGNAVERLGKNLIGIRALFKGENIIPFICYGNGCDFKPGCSILDRVITMNDFFPLNTLFIEKKHLPFEPVSMFFRYKKWSIAEMTAYMLQISEKALAYYLH